MALTSAKKKHTEALNAKVNFGSRAFKHLTEGSCETFFSYEAYITAKTLVETTGVTQSLAHGHVQEASKALTVAVQDSIKQIHGCYCKTLKDQVMAWRAATADQAANNNAWQRAHHIKCVLDGTVPCKIPPAPTVKPITIEKTVLLAMPQCHAEDRAVEAAAAAERSSAALAAAKKNPSEANKKKSDEAAIKVSARKAEEKAAKTKKTKEQGLAIALQKKNEAKAEAKTRAAENGQKAKNKQGELNQKSRKRMKGL